MYKISIVTIVKNDIAGFLRTKKSILSQDFKDFEWLIVDGASTDKTREEVLSLRHFESVTVISEQDSGIYNAMNKGLNLANGIYVNFMNAGDVYASESVLGELVRLIGDKNPDLVYGDAFKMDLNSIVVYSRAGRPLGIKYGMFACHQSILYKNAICKKIKFNEQLKISGDYDFTISFFKIAEFILYVNLAVCIFNSGGISNSNYLLGRNENWVVQRENLKISLLRRLINRLLYLFLFNIKENFPFLYRKLRARSVLLLTPETQVVEYKSPI